MSQEFEAGDFLIFQLESGYGMMRVLESEATDHRIWHIAIYNDLFLDPDFADNAIADGSTFSISTPHIALTERAFNSTQVAKIGHRALIDEDLEALIAWKSQEERPVSDRSVRLLMGLR